MASSTYTKRACRLAILIVAAALVAVVLGDLMARDGACSSADERTAGFSAAMGQRIPQKTPCDRANDGPCIALVARTLGVADPDLVAVFGVGGER